MAITVLTNAYISVGGVDLSNHCQSVAIETTDDDVEITAMGATAKAYAKGLGDANITATFFQDFAAGSVDATLSPLKAGSTPFTVGVRPVNAARSATNPEFQISAQLFGYNPLDGSVGDASTTDVTFRNASQAGALQAHFVVAKEPFVIHDYAAYQKSWKEMDKAEAKAEREKVRAVGAIVQRDAAVLFAPFSDKSAKGYKVRVRARGVAVEQSLKRTTGLHPEFGSLQMQRSLGPALERNADELEKQLTAMLDDIGRKEGF